MQHNACVRVCARGPLFHEKDKREREPLLRCFCLFRISVKAGKKRDDHQRKSMKRCRAGISCLLPRGSVTPLWRCGRANASQVPGVTRAAFVLHALFVCVMSAVSRLFPSTFGGSRRGIEERADSQESVGPLAEGVRGEVRAGFADGSLL
jgi:hypothetical protein